MGREAGKMTDYFPGTDPGFVDIAEPEEKEFSISGGAFYKENPEKLLAEEYEASGKFGKVKKYKPREGLSVIDTLNIIETPVFIGHGITDVSAGSSVIAAPATEIATPEITDNREKAIEATEKSLIKRQRSEKRKIKDFEEPSALPTISFEDVLRTQNKKLTEDEIRAFLWYQDNIGNTYKGKWLTVFNPANLSQDQEAAFIKNWIEKGTLFYYKGDLLPDYKYFSENLYDRKTELENDKNDIIGIYGDAAYNQQEKKLNEVFAETYAARLKLDDPVVDRRLHLKPYSEFAKEVMIKNWDLDNSTGEPGPFRVILSGAAETYGKINWKSKKESRWSGDRMNELSIHDAFRYYLKHDRPKLPYNYTYQDIFSYYLDKRGRPSGMEPTVFARHRALTKEVGEKFFGQFLAEIILENDRVKIERLWNEKYNGNRPIRLEKIPIAFECALYYPGNKELDIRPEKREAVAFASIRGSSLNAYQVGVGKTYAAVFTIAQFLDAGHCVRPFLVVPNAVYKQFYSEMKGILPHKKINDLYNLSKDYLETLKDENGVIQMVEEGSISMLTYEGFERVGFNEFTQANLMTQLEEALTQIQEMDSKGGVRTGEKIKGTLGIALRKTEVNIEELGFDFVCFDEAHALKNIFSSVKARKSKGDEGEDASKGKKMYEIQGSTSTRGIKAYCLCSYIQLQNNGRNVMLLTATPFTNSPLEVYSMLSLVAYHHLRTIGLSNINDFFDNYCHMSYELIIDAKLKPVRKQIFKAFDNLLSLQKLVYSYMLHKEAGKADANGNIIALIRPDKYLLPYKGHFNEKSEFVPAKPDDYIDTALPLSAEQKILMDEIIQYAEGKISYDELSSRGEQEIEVDEPEEDDEGNIISKSIPGVEDFVMDESFMQDDEKKGVRILRAVNFARSLALSPHLYEFSGLPAPDYDTYINKSPKLKYIMDCVASVKKWHEDKKEPVSGMVIYMDRGKKYFELIKEYLVKVVGFNENEIGIIKSGMKKAKANKELIKNKFNGLQFNEASKTFNDIPDTERVKVIIGTSTIREGLNLNRYATVLFNAFVDWNPTDEIQLEGRIWRQGNSFAKVRIVIPMMADSMDIFMFEKLQQKTERINSIWNHDGKSNVLKVEEIDPKEQKEHLITDPKILAELEVEGDIADMDENIATVDGEMQTAQNIIGFYENRAALEKELIKVLQLIYPDKQYPSLDTMIKDFENMLTSGKTATGELVREVIRRKGVSYYNYDFIDYSGDLQKSYRYGTGKAAVAMLKKAKHSFLDKYGLADDKAALQDFINEQARRRERINEDKERLASPEHINDRAIEIERKRKQRKVVFASVSDRVKEFEKLNYLLGIKSGEDFMKAEKYIKMMEIDGCPPVTKEGLPDITPQGVASIEACLDKVPQTKDLHTDANGDYTEARKKIHEVIKGKLRVNLKCVVPNEKPIAILTGGVPGSGKTTFLKKYAPNLSKEKIYKIDADEIRAMLPEYKGWNSKATHKETQDIYRGLLKDISDGKPCRFDILWDGTMNRADNYLPLIGDLRDLGYEIFMIYVQVPWDVSRKRTLDRYVKGSVPNGKFGRYVPMAVVDEANQKGTAAFSQLKYKADGFMMVDGQTGTIIERGGKDLLADRGYFDKEPTDKEAAIKRAKAIALALKLKIRILKLKNE